MKKIDFLSEFPRLYIFQQEKNKTNFGGILFLIYIIIMIIIALTYILDFYLNDKFEIEFLSINNQTSNEDLDKINEDLGLNPITEFILAVPKETFYDNMRISYYDEKGKLQIKNLTENIYYPLEREYNLSGELFGVKFKSRITNFTAELLYFCNGISIYDCPNERIDGILHKDILLSFTPLLPKIDHQNPLKPISDDEKYNLYELFGVEYPYSYSFEHNWRVIQYKEKKGLSRIFDKLRNLKTEYYSGYFDSRSTELSNNTIKKIKREYYRPLLVVKINNRHEVYDDYKRRKITELDVLSTISALFTPIRLVFIFVYRYYFKVFNNYKLVENIFKPKNLLNLKIYMI